MNGPNYIFLLFRLNQRFLPNWLNLKTIPHECVLDRPKQNVFSCQGMREDIFNLLINCLKNNLNNLVIPEYNKKNNNFIQNYGEGFFGDEFIENLHFIISLFESEGEWYFGNDALNLDIVYTEYCNNNNIKPILTIYKVEGSFRNKNHYFYQLPDEKYWNSGGEKKFFCNFNWSPRDFRWAVLALLRYYNLLEAGHVSSPRELMEQNHTIEEQFSDLHVAIDKFFSDNIRYDDIKKSVAINFKLPFIIDDRASHNKDKEFQFKNPNFRIPLLRARYHSYFELINETCFYKEHFLTEKTFIPIQLGKPFLMMSSYGTLSALRSLGYKTFSPLLNEDYDKEKNPSTRMFMVIEELRRLYDLFVEDNDTFMSIYKELLEISEFNRNKFLC